MVYFVAGLGPFCGEDWHTLSGGNWYTLFYHLQENGHLFTSAFKHNFFLNYSQPETGDSSRVSGLYRAARWTGELTAEEEPFAVLSPLIHARPELGVEIGDFVCKGDNGKSWPEVKVAFGL